MAWTAQNANVRASVIAPFPGDWSRLRRFGPSAISKVQFNRFIRRVVLPRWSQGFTVVAATGIWNGGVENSRVLIRLHKGLTEDLAAIDDIAAAYKTQFGQDSVLRQTLQVCASF